MTDRDDMVEHPPHYTYAKYEVIDVLQAFFERDPLLWQVGKYICRAGRKGPALQDLRKAKFYLERAIDREACKNPQDLLDRILEGETK